VARLWRDRRSGKLLLEASGKTYNTLSQVEPRQREQLERLIYDLGAWLGGSLQATQDERLASVAQPVEKQAPPAGSQEPIPLPSPSASSAAQAPQIGLPVTQQAQEVRSPSMKLPEILATAIAPAKKDAPPVARSIAAQVDEIVQEKLPGSPFSERVIRIMEVPGKGMRVIVDLGQYESVNDVQDAEVQQFLRECVAEWERRSSMQV
jgi:hypothetical protein